MIDIPSVNVKVLHAQIIQSWAHLETLQSKRVFPILMKPWRDTARELEDGIITIEDNVAKYSKQLNDKIQIGYRRTVDTYFKFTLDSLGLKSAAGLLIKDTEGIFWQVMELWILFQTVAQVVLINNTTKKLLKAVIARGIANGLTNKEIAGNLRELSVISNKNRALSIAKTQTHTAYSRAVDETIRSSTKQMQEKEWSAVGDKRTRTPHLNVNGAVVAMEDTFFVDGEPMRYPGDPNASGRNVILCRCVAFYTTITRRNVLLHTMLGGNYVR